MENHGFGRKTFRFETDATGNAVVHHTDGRLTADQYGFDTGKILAEIHEQFDLSKNVYLCVINKERGGGVGGTSGDEGGFALISIRGLTVPHVAHELGHAFGLLHDFRNTIKLIPTSQIRDDTMLTSFCAAEWLDAHPYFSFGQATFNQNTVINILPPSLASPPYDIRYSFEVTDNDGLYQAQLVTGPGVIACKPLNGKNTTVEFVTSQWTIGNGERIDLRVMDVLGNYTFRTFPANITALLPHPETVPVPDPNLAAAVRIGLGLTPGGAITQLDMLRLVNFYYPSRGNIPPGKNILDFTGLEHATNLQILGLRGHPTRDIRPLIRAIAGLMHLRELRLTSNQIVDVSPLAALSHLTGLRELRLTDNQITDVSNLAELTSMIKLWLDHNRLTDISPLAGLANLRELRLAGNQIDDVTPLSDLMNLTRVNLQHNSISDLSPLVANAGLGVGDHVDVSRNFLNYLSVYTHIPALQERGVEVTFDHRTPHRIRILKGNNQERARGEALANPFVVEIRDENSVVFGGVPVLFTVTAGDGTLSTTSTTTDTNGRAESILTLGPHPGTNSVEVSVVEIREKQTFNAEGIRIPKRLEIISGGDQEGLPGAALENPFVVEVRDQSNKPLPGVQVTFSVSSGGGTLSATSVTTDSNGRAENTLTLGPNPGTNTVTVSVTGSQQTRTFNAEGIRIPKTLEIISGDDQEGPPGAALENPFIVEVRDQTDEPLPDVQVMFTIRSGGGTLSVTNATTDSNGRAESILTLGSNPGTNTVTVSVTGIQEGQTFSAEGIRIPKTLEIISGNDQEGLPGAALEKPFIVEVRDRSDKPLPGVEVTFSVTSGGGALSATSVTTDSNGRAESILTLGPNPGRNTVTVSVTGIQEQQTFTVEGIRIPETLDIVSGNDQEGLPGAALENPFVVEVRDQSDKPLPGIQVTFSVSSGGGALSATSVTTDSDGRAESTLTLGPNPGANTVTVSVTGIQAQQTFNAEGIRIPETLDIVSGNDQEGLPGAALENPFVVEVRDRFDNPFSGAQVTFSVTSGGGTLSATSVRTNSNGRAESRLTLGPNPGTNTVTVSVTGIQAQQTFNAEGIRIPLAFWIISGDKQQGLPGEALAKPFVVEVRDQSGEPLPGAQVIFAVSSGGGTLSVTSTTTDSDGRAESILTLGPNPGPNSVTVSVTGIQEEQTVTAIAEPPPIPQDVNRDDVVNILDLVFVASALGDEGQGLVADVNGDGVVNILDLVSVAGALGNVAAAPSANPRALAMLTATDVGQWLAQAGELDLADATSSQGLVFLKQLLAALTPADTALMPNYPNPFNPETWIPYRLAEDAGVTLTIYDTNGALVRRLDVGHRSAGFYESRSEAIYWDGRNDFGEGVVSGVYFYHLSADGYSATRKMLIIK